MQPWRKNKPPPHRSQPNDLITLRCWILRCTRAGMEKREGGVMETFKDYSLLDWLMFTQLMLIWVFIAFKSGVWLFESLAKKGWRWWNRKDKKALAMDSFYEAFNISELGKGEVLTAKTEDGLVIQIYRPKGGDNA